MVPASCITQKNVSQFVKVGLDPAVKTVPDIFTGTYRKIHVLVSNSVRSSKSLLSRKSRSRRHPVDEIVASKRGYGPTNSSARCAARNVATSAEAGGARAALCVRPTSVCEATSRARGSCWHGPLYNSFNPAHRSAGQFRRGAAPFPRADPCHRARDLSVFKFSLLGPRSLAVSSRPTRFCGDYSELRDCRGDCERQLIRAGAGDLSVFKFSFLGAEDLRLSHRAAAIVTYARGALRNCCGD